MNRTSDHGGKRFESKMTDEPHLPRFLVKRSARRGWMVWDRHTKGKDSAFVTFVEFGLIVGGAITLGGWGRSSSVVVRKLNCQMSSRPPQLAASL